MHVTHRKRFVSRDLVALAARRPQELAALSEAHYHDQGNTPRTRTAATTTRAWRRLTLKGCTPA